MRPQQRLLVLPLAFAVTWAASALALPAHSTARPATLCAPDERPLFSCHVLNQGHAGSLHATGLRPWAGLVVYRGTRQIETQACRGELLLEANWLDAVSSRAPGGINISEPADSFFDAWIM